MFINGLQADLDIYDVFTLLETLKDEAKLMEGLHAIGKQVGYDSILTPDLFASFKFGIFFNSFRQ